ncbi:MAG: YihY/virulence factor BrkB family protein [Tardiphaga sp.]|jgi:membrane protein|nr:YihY/virulence factor BrkB family protein [Tardiphaga sp.]MDB5547254.1 YihY/virulence factor BrkB family protein [Tardiphaga sp.]MDB5574538.1 YihY/virulence factor BrkB family protein [Tardiphaga sp.]MDB5624223.1 YihY/virulence factor BrkB family protein [Tardiphaga sp.]
MSRLSDRAEDLALVAITATLAVALTLQFRPVRLPKALPADAPLPPRDYSERIAEPGRGRDSEHPLQIPRRGWRDIFWRFYQRTGEDRLLAIAAGVVFYGLLAVFPTITALVSLYGLFADPKTIGDNLQSLALMLPEGSFQIVQDQIGRVLSKGNAALGTTFLFGLALALWSANAGVKAVIDALNVVYGETEKRGFFKLNALSLLFTISGIAALLLMVGAVVALPIVLNNIWITEEGKALVKLARWPILLLLLLVALGLLYRFGPSRLGARWEWLSVGTLVAALLWIAGSSLLSWYLSNFGNYDATYGSLGAAIGLMMWMWMSAIIVLCGAELNSEIEHQTAVDSTVGPRKPIGSRGAAMADTVGAAQS